MSELRQGRSHPETPWGTAPVVSRVVGVLGGSALDARVSTCVNHVSRSVGETWWHVSAVPLAGDWRGHRGPGRACSVPTVSGSDPGGPSSPLRLPCPPGFASLRPPGAADPDTGTFRWGARPPPSPPTPLPRPWPFQFDAIFDSGCALRII